MIYCVIPEGLADELLDKMRSYYAGDENVEVIVDRRSASRRRPGNDGTADGELRTVRDRRRARIAGEIPATPLAE